MKGSNTSGLKNICHPKIYNDAFKNENYIAATGK